MKYRVHRLDVSMTRDQVRLEQELITSIEEGNIVIGNRDFTVLSGINLVVAFVISCVSS